MTKTYLLVHGAWHGEWSWNATKSMLISKGHKVATLDLPGHGNDNTEIADITFEGYVKAVEKKLSTIKESVILAGHSLSGAVISQVAEHMPEKIDQLLFLAAFILGENECVLDIMKADTNGQLLSNLIFSDDQSYAYVSEETLKEVVYNGGTTEQLAFAAPLLKPQATEPFFANVALSNPVFGRMKKRYIMCLDDKVLTPETCNGPEKSDTKLSHF